MNEENKVPEGVIDPSKVVKVDMSGVLKDTDRLTVHFELHHEHCCVHPVSVECKYSAFLETQEQPYMRRLKITPGHKDKPLNPAWLEEAWGSIIILNPPDAVRRNKLTDEDKAEIEAATVFIAMGDGTPWRIKPGRFFIAEPSDITQVRLWVPAGEREITLHVMPR